jgi:hypothetical protein
LIARSWADNLQRRPLADYRVYDDRRIVVRRIDEPLVRQGLERVIDLLAAPAAALRHLLDDLERPDDRMHSAGPHYHSGFRNGTFQWIRDDGYLSVTPEEFEWIVGSFRSCVWILPFCIFWGFFGHPMTELRWFIDTINCHAFGFCGSPSLLRAAIDFVWSAIHYALIIVLSKFTAEDARLPAVLSLVYGRSASLGGRLLPRANKKGCETQIDPDSSFGRWFSSRQGGGRRLYFHHNNPKWPFETKLNFPSA